MEDFKNNIVVYSGVCRCCFQDEIPNTFNGLWDQHLYNGNVEVYGEMITECFLIPWVRPENPEANVEQICVDCVSKVRDAFNFKRQLLAVENQLMQHFKQVNEEENDDNKPGLTLEVHIDGNDDKILTKPKPRKDHESEDGGGTNDKDESDSQDETIYSEDNLMEPLENSDNEYENIEFVEEDVDYDVIKKNIEKTKVNVRIPNKNGEGSRVVKNYRPIDMDEAVRCALAGTLTHAQAAVKYGVPRKTVYAKVKRIKAKREREMERLILKKPSPLIDNISEQDISHVRLINLINDIEMILTYTNATPFKTTNTSYGCVYCDFVLKATKFEDQDRLRAHTRVEHANERIQAVEIFMKPSVFEVLKVDIYNLVCTVCCEVITGWLEMFEHLNKAHDVVLDEAHTKVIPYVLDVSCYKCAICKEKFNNYHRLDSHMNCHYNNYVCEDCGETFLSYTRIKAHMKVHKIGKFPCDFPGCGKVFSLGKYRKKHYMLVHTDEKLVKCQYCHMRLHDEVQKQNHIKKKHRDKIKFITCDVCGMVLEGKINYYYHMRSRHKYDHSMKCKHCNVLCTNRALLREHLRTHGDLDIFCDICKKSFLAVRYMKQHKRRIHGIISQNET